MVILYTVIIILIVLAIIWCIACTCGNQNGGFFSMNPFKNRYKNNFTSASSIDPKQLPLKKAIITNSSTIPPQFLPKNAASHAILANNISNLQGKVEPEMFGYFFPKDESSTMKKLMDNTTCTGYGENVTCKPNKPTIAPNKDAATAMPTISQQTLTNTGTFNSLYGNSSGSPFNANVASSVYGNISDGNSMAISASKIASAEQELWMANRLSDGQVSMDNLDLAPLAILAAPTINYESYLDSLVIDERLLNNHSNWVHEMLPWAGTAQMVDTIDEAVSNSVPWTGLRRPQSVAQDSSALYQTELDAKSFINNPKFVFNT